VHETTTLLLATSPNIHRFKKNSLIHSAINLFLIRLLKTSPNLKYVATLPCNLSLMACSANINVSPGGGVATYARCDATFNIHLTANLPRNLPVKRILHRLRFDRIMVVSLCPRFFAHPDCTGQSISIAFPNCETLTFAVFRQ